MLIFIQTKTTCERKHSFNETNLIWRYMIPKCQMKTSDVEGRWIHVNKVDFMMQIQLFVLIFIPCNGPASASKISWPVSHTMCSSRKYPYSPPKKGLKFPGGGGSVYRPKHLKKCMRLNWNFRRGGGGGGVLEKIPYMEAWIFLGTTHVHIQYNLAWGNFFVIWSDPYNFFNLPYLTVT